MPMAGAKRRWPWQANDIGGQADRLKTEAQGTYSEEFEEDDWDDSRPAPTRWISSGPHTPSPFGFAEDDGGLKQVENGAWRRAFSAPSTSREKRFVPRTHVPQNRSSTRSPHPNSYSNKLVWQTICAALLVGGSYFVAHNSNPHALSVFDQANSLFQTDYTDRVQPLLAKAFSDMHVSVPTFGSSSHILQAPLVGEIVADYSSSHPEVWISASANTQVQSIGSGTVLNVAKSGKTYVVKVDDGVVGTSIYAGLGAVSVKENEEVSPGEAIGRLPSTPSHPMLRYSLVKNGEYLDPHQEIQFSGVGQ
jgi:murein DD-endopeptidase MepM/ murein hydrolase activator NlpD